MSPRRSSQLSTKRTRTYIIGALIALLLFVVFRSRQRPQPLPPLPGTYQYFSETDFHNQNHRFGGVSHCDSRFVPERQPNIGEVRESLHALLESYAATMRDLQIETWISHGALLGWYWNRKLLPWDTDLDVQMSAESLGFLANSYNMTEYRYPESGKQPSRTYLLDINPHYTIVSERDVANKIDGRWIDKTDGKFIDITAVHKVPSEAEDKPKTLFCKDGHKYKERDIYPLRASTLEDTIVSVPVDSQKLLQEEYGEKALTNEHFHWHHFNRATKEWEFD